MIYLVIAASVIGFVVYYDLGLRVGIRMKRRIDHDVWKEDRPWEDDDYFFVSFYALFWPFVVLGVGLMKLAKFWIRRRIA